MYKIPAKTLFLGKNLISVSECHSTNQLAFEHSQSPVPEGTVIITNRQTKGRGQRGNVWTSEDGMNLTFSVILRPAFLDVKNQFYLAITTALAIHDAVEDLIPAKCFIKWPNDILVNHQKICGILIENQLQGSRIHTTVAGIGLNVNQQRFDYPRAGSLSSLTGEMFSLQHVLETVLEKFEARYLQLREEKNDSMLNDYLNVLYKRNQVQMFRDKQRMVFQGIIKGINEEGLLHVETDTGDRLFDIKDVEYITHSSQAP